MKKKIVYILVAIMVFSFAACSSDKTPTTGESGTSEVPSTMEGKAAEPNSVPSEGAIPNYVEGTPESFPAEQLIPADVEIINEETDTSTGKTLANVSFRSTKSAEELTTFYNNALESLGATNVDFIKANGTLSFTGMIEDTAQVDVSVLPAADGNGYMVSVNYYLF